MPVKIQTGGKLLFPLTSPPAKPMPTPSGELIAKTVTFLDREILISIPFPDSVELVVPITNAVLAVPDTSKKPDLVKYAELDLDIQNGLLETKFALPDWMCGSVKPSKYGAEFFARYDPAQQLNRARLTLERKKCDDFGSWTFRLEFSPAKAGSSGLVQLIAAIEAALPWADVPKLLKAMAVSRIDAAVDCIGAHPLDLIGRIPKSGKRLLVSGNKGHPETIYFYEAKKLPSSPPHHLSGIKTTGPMRLMLYERRDYHKQLALPLPYAECPVTRAEVRIRWNKGRPPLSAIGGIGNPFIGRHVAYAAEVSEVGGTAAWRRFCLAAYAGGVSQAMFAWLPGPGGKYAKAYENCAGDLIDETCWVDWNKGLEFTGLNDWIAQAGT